MDTQTTSPLRQHAEGGLSSSVLFCDYCNEPIKPGQPTVADEWGEPGARMHIGCAAEDEDDQDIDRDMGDS